MVVYDVSSIVSKNRIVNDGKLLPNSVFDDDDDDANGQVEAGLRNSAQHVTEETSKVLQQLHNIRDMKVVFFAMAQAWKI